MKNDGCSCIYIEMEYVHEFCLNSNRFGGSILRLVKALEIDIRKMSPKVALELGFHQL